jgi:hypothetical protein
MRFDTILARIKAPQFLQSKDFLEEMGGHELLSQVLAHIHSIRGQRLSTGETFNTERFENELVNAITSEYRPGMFIPDDFAELAARLK